MNLDKKQIDFEAYCKRIIGLKLSFVDYYDSTSDHDPNEPSYKTKYPEVHDVRDAIVLRCGNDKIEIYADDEGEIALRLNDESVLDDDYYAYPWNVNNSEIWGKVIGEKIIDLNIKWRSYVRQKNEVCYPCYMTLIFPNENKIFISAAEFPELRDDGIHWYLGRDYNRISLFANNLIITNSEVLARQLEMIK